MDVPVDPETPRRTLAISRPSGALTDDPAASSATVLKPSALRHTGAHPQYRRPEPIDDP